MRTRSPYNSVHIDHRVLYPTLRRKKNVFFSYRACNDFAEDDAGDSGHAAAPANQIWASLASYAQILLWNGQRGDGARGSWASLVGGPRAAVRSKRVIYFRLRHNKQRKHAVTGGNEKFGTLWVRTDGRSDQAKLRVGYTSLAAVRHGCRASKFRCRRSCVCRTSSPSRGR